MLPGPSLIFECSACGMPLAQETLQSGNTIGARFWTDGKRIAPMLPDEPALVKCPHCRALVWIEELEPIGETDPFSPEPDGQDGFPDARSGLFPTVRDYEKALKSCGGDREKEYYVRLQIWWTGNHSRREPGESAPLKPSERKNLRSLAALLDETDDEGRLMKAEILRELGEFADAEKLLAADFRDELRIAVARIRGLARARDPRVAEIEGE